MANMLKSLSFYIQQYKSVPHDLRGSLSSFAKNFFKWNKLKNFNNSNLTENTPWIVFGAIQYLESKLNTKSTIYFEFGSGASTLFFAKRVKSLISVEHNREWFQRVSSVVGQLKNANTQLFLKEPELNNGVLQNSDFGDPLLFLSADSNYLEKYNFHQYASKINEYPDQYFDFILVDGRARPSCLDFAISKLKINGFLILDNSDRKYYTSHLSEKLKSFIIVFNEYGPGPYSPNFWQTTIYQKK